MKRYTGYPPAVSLFSQYEPEPVSRDPLPPDLKVRDAVVPDVEAIARIHVERHGTDLKESVRGATRDIENGHPKVFVAETAGSVVAYGRVRLFDPGEAAEPTNAPPGWYLLGIVVDRPFRRRGIGHAVTRHRLEWIAKRSGEAYYFCSAWNRPSIHLHSPFGFQEVTRELRFPKVSFTGGTGILFRAVLEEGTSLGRFPAER